MTQDLQYRLYNATIPPPDDAWNNIAETLDIEAQQKLSLKLQQAAIEPPAIVWENIASELYGTETAKVVPITSKWKKLAVAAVAIGIIALAGLTYMLTRETAGEQAAGTNKQQVPPPENDLNSDIVTKGANVASATQPQTSPGYPGSNNMVAFASAKRIAPRVRYAKVDERALRPLYAQNTTNVDGIIERPVRAEPKTYVMPKEYLTITAPNGEPVRISTKFTDAVGYMYGGERTDNVSAALKSISWKRRFQTWSNKLISNTAFIPSATNFLDIIELEELLKE
jgi:hypothetical protein